MADALLLIAVFAVPYLGFACLALSQRRHWSRALHGAPPRSVVLALRTSGGALLVAALWIALVRDGASFGALLWATGISLAALAVAFTLAWNPAVLRPLAALGRRLVMPFGRRG